jgi:signal transduction histidine kinase
MAYFDNKRIAQVISNLINNAIRHTPYGQKIVISSAKVDDGFIRFTIQDSGQGIAEQELESIFEQFIQGHSQAVNTGGTCLGLAICKEIIQAHKGRIWAENWSAKQKIQGAVFRFTLPISELNWKENNIT